MSENWMWRGKASTQKEIEMIVEMIGDLYRTSKRRMEYMENMACVAKNRKIYSGDCLYVSFVTMAVDSCSKVTQLIINNDYLMEREKNWYLKFFTRSAYYRNRKKAIKEFIDNISMQENMGIGADYMNC